MPNVDIRRDLGRLGSQARASRVHRFGIPIRPAGFTVQYDVDRKQLAKPRRQGLTVKQIAPRCGCSVTTWNVRCDGTGSAGETGEHVQSGSVQRHDFRSSEMRKTAMVFSFRFPSHAPTARIMNFDGTTALGAVAFGGQAVDNGGPA